MFNYENDIKPLESLLADDTAIAEHLSHITAKPILIADVENFLDFNGLANRNPITGAWEGVLPSIVTTEGHPLAAGLASLFTHINKPRSINIDTTQIPWCDSAWALLGGLVTAGAITSQQRDEFYALGGGLPYAGTTAQDISDLRNEYSLIQSAKIVREDANMLYNVHISPVMNSPTVTTAQIITAMQAMIAALEE